MEFKSIGFLARGRDSESSARRRSFGSPNTGAILSGQKSIFRMLTQKLLKYKCIGRKSFVPPIGTILQRSVYDLPDVSREMFIKHCTVLIERRGFSNIHLGVKKLSRDGKVETFDISYGYVIRHYCKCNFGDNPVQESEIKAFEVGSW